MSTGDTWPNGAPQERVGSGRWAKRSAHFLLAFPLSFSLSIVRLLMPTIFFLFEMLIAQRGYYHVGFFAPPLGLVSPAPLAWRHASAGERETEDFNARRMKSPEGTWKGGTQTRLNKHSFFF